MCSLQRKKKSIYRFIEAILEEKSYCKKLINKHFNNKLIMSEEDKQRFQSSNKYWICDKLFDVGDNKARHHDHVKGKYGSSPHWSCDINRNPTKTNPVIFHNIIVYDSHVIIIEIGKFNVKVNVIPNGLEKCMAFTVYKNLIFIDHMQFMNSSLDTLSDNGFKFITTV